MTEIRNLFHEVNFDIFGVTETHLKENIPDDMISVENYRISGRKDRKGKVGGGVLVYMKENLEFSTVTEFSNDNLEASWINVTMRSQKVLFGCIYRPPTDNKFHNCFRDALSHVWLKRRSVIIAGDFNANLLNDPNNREDGQDWKQLKRILNCYSYKNIIDLPTRITPTSKTLIDLIVTSDTSKVKESGSVDFGISDHHLIYAVFYLLQSKPKPKIITVNDNRSTYLNSLKEDMSTAPWHIMEIFDDVDDCQYAWHLMYKDIMQQHVKTRRAKIRSKSLPWIDTKIRKEMK
eukprot:Seg4452.4 transcript_id=Seg4452.4/GoldUCD/mRNA.D3Y31 product="hypothetical protein" protein_id=Seg4452.4/GoldUCD/D3Y31